MSDYTQCFWDSNLSTSHGFETLCEHSSRNFEVLSSIINLLETKLSSDDLHARAQTKIAKSYMKADKSNKNDEIVKKIADKIEKEANERVLKCEKIKNDILDPLKEYLKVDYERFKKAKSECSKFNKERKAAFDNATKSVKNLNSKLKSHDTFVKKLGPSAEDEKNKVKVFKSSAGVKTAEKEASTAISNLNASIASWRSSMELFCRTIHGFDISFLTQIKEVLEKLSTVMTDFSSVIKSIQGEYKVLSDEIDPNSVLEQFIREKQTNEELPCFAYTSHKIEGGIIEHTIELSNDPSMRTENPIYSSNDNLSHEAVFRDSDNRTATNSLKNRQDSVSSGTSAPSGYVVALYDYTAQADDELSFSIGDRIKIIYKEDESWYMGEMDNGNRGIFPITYAKSS